MYRNNDRFNKRRRFPSDQNRPRRPKMAGLDISVLLSKIKIGETNGLTPVAPYVATTSFETLSLDPKLKRNIVTRGYTTPTPIQDQAIPAILSGRDLIGSANTGTGKTAAFLVPLINKVFRVKNQKVLIVCPTRELAVQIYEEFRKLSDGMGIYTALCIGGNDIFRQRQELKRNPAFVIGTPGRLKDFINRGYINMNTFNNVVLDETDQMVDIGFINEIKLFISMLPKQRQSLFFSATMSPKVEEILSAFVKNPVTINVKTRDTAANVEQDVMYVAKDKGKLQTLHEVLLLSEYEKVLVFGRTKFGVERLEQELTSRGHSVGSIHGDKRQKHRSMIIKKFKHSEIKVLLATDVASRGLDISGVTHVINYDLPATYEDYIHRIGRTGRADKKGKAITFIG